jgi:hypothetical protein
MAAQPAIDTGGAGDVGSARPAPPGEPAACSVIGPIGFMLAPAQVSSRSPTARLTIELVATLASWPRGQGQVLRKLNDHRHDAFAQAMCTGVDQAQSLGRRRA